MKFGPRTRRDLARRRARLFGKRYAAPGTPAGTLHDTDTQAPAAQVTVTRYSAAVLERTAALPAAPPALAEGALWAHLQGPPTADQLRQLGTSLALHPLMLEDIQNQGQRPKLDEFERGLFLILPCPYLVGEELEIHEFSLFLGKDTVVSVLDGPGDWFAPVQRRLDEADSRLRQRGADYLAYVLMDLVVDHAYPVLEALSDRMETLELAVFESPHRSQLADIHRVQRSLLTLRRHLWPAREVLSRVLRDEKVWFSADLRPYLSDVYDHLVQLIELVESYRELGAAMMEIYLSAQNNQLNEVMRLLTVISTIFIPLTFIVGVYGMNFSVNEHSWWAMPELRWDYGYPVLWLVMVALGGGMAAYFKRRGWF